MYIVKFLKQRFLTILQSSYLQILFSAIISTYQIHTYQDTCTTNVMHVIYVESDKKNIRWSM